MTVESRPNDAETSFRVDEYLSYTRAPRITILSHPNYTHPTPDLRFSLYSFSKMC